MAPVDLRVAVHRGPENRAGERVLHSVHRDESLHHFRDGYRRFLRARLGHVLPLLQDMEGDQEKAEGSAQSAGRQGRKLVEEVQFQVSGYLNETCIRVLV